MDTRWVRRPAASPRTRLRSKQSLGGSSRIGATRPGDSPPKDYAGGVSRCAAPIAADSQDGGEEHRDAAADAEERGAAEVAAVADATPPRRCKREREEATPPTSEPDLEDWSFHEICRLRSDLAAAERQRDEVREAFAAEEVARTQSQERVEELRGALEEERKRHEECRGKLGETAGRNEGLAAMSHALQLDLDWVRALNRDRMPLPTAARVSRVRA